MPMLLTTAFDPGDLDAGASYPRAQIIHFEIDSESKFIRLSVVFGNMSGDDWVSGPASPKHTFIVRDSDYDTMVAEAATSEEGYAIYAGAKRVLYQWLIDNGHLSGTVE